jgi:hypothetical protein
METIADVLNAGWAVQRGTGAVWLSSLFRGVHLVSVPYWLEQAEADRDT